MLGPPDVPCRGGPSPGRERAKCPDPAGSKDPNPRPALQTPRSRACRAGPSEPPPCGLKACGRLAAVLDDAARQTLDLEAGWWRYAATKDAAIRDRFAEDPSTYYRRLGSLIDDPAAMDHAPVLVRRLRRQRTRRIGSRSGRRLAG